MGRTLQALVHCFTASFPIYNVTLPLKATVHFIETARKIILAVKCSSVKYFLFVGGAGSLHVPGTPESCIDHPDFFGAYRRAIPMTEAQIVYMEERFGVMGDALRAYRNARIATSEGRATDDNKKAIADYEASIKPNDQAIALIKAARSAYMFFEGNTSFKWSFVSPSALYRPGKRTGEYEISVNDMVLVGEQKEGEGIFEGRLTGISVADMAIAIADEVEMEKLIGKHWSAWGDISEDLPASVYLRLDGAEGGSL
jgi:putative NADH-flavin reductase